MFETTGSAGFASRKCIMPRKTQKNSLTNYFEKRRTYKQQQRISYLENKAKAGGLSKSERLELIAQKFDSALNNLDLDVVKHANGNSLIYVA